MKHKRSILIVEDGQIVFRHDNNNIHCLSSSEQDLNNALKRLHVAGLVKINKIESIINIEDDLKDSLCRLSEKGNFNIDRFKAML